MVCNRKIHSALQVSFFKWRFNYGDQSQLSAHKEAEEHWHSLANSLVGPHVSSCLPSSVEREQKNRALETVMRQPEWCVIAGKNTFSRQCRILVTSWLSAPNFINQRYCSGLLANTGHSWESVTEIICFLVFEQLALMVLENEHFINTDSEWVQIWCRFMRLTVEMRWRLVKLAESTLFQLFYPNYSKYVLFNKDTRLGFETRWFSA